MTFTAASVPPIAVTQRHAVFAQTPALLCALSDIKCRMNPPLQHTMCPQSLPPCCAALCCPRGTWFCPPQQLLLSAKAQLESVVTQRLDEAIAAHDHAGVLRFVKLYKPLAAPDKGLRR